MKKSIRVRGVSKLRRQPTAQTDGRIHGHPVRRMLIALDASPAAACAAQMGFALASRLATSVAMVHVVDSSRIMVGGTPAGVPEAIDDLRSRGRLLCQEMAHRHGRKKYEMFVMVGSPSVEILATAARWKADLLVMGSHGGARSGRFFLGSNVETVIREAPCPVLAVGPQDCLAHPNRIRARRVRTRR
ncbi:MAG: universal stress protein [Phycisphaerales bacterium]|nr:universal stress protein [Phycisphaerales bacterium]